MIRCLLVIAVAFAFAKPPSCRIEEIGSSTEAYLRIVRHLATNRRAVSADALEELAEREEAANPFRLGLVTMIDLDGLPFRQSLDEHLGGVDWAVARAKLRELARALRNGEGKRETANKQTRPLLIVKPILGDMKHEAGAPREEAHAKITSSVAQDGTLYVLFSTALVAPQIVLKYDGQKVQTIDLGAATGTRTLVTTAGGEVVAVCLLEDKLEVTDLKSETKKTYPISRKLRTHLERHRFALSGGLIPQIHFVGGSIAISWSTVGGSHMDVIGPRLSKPATSHFALHASTDGKMLYAYGTDQSSQELVLKELVSGKELLRIKSSTRLDFVLGEDAAGNLSFVTVNGKNKNVTWRTYPAGTKLTYRWKDYYGPAPLFVRNAKGGLSLVFRGSYDGLVWDAGTAAPRPIPSLPSSPQFFSLSDGRTLAIGHRRDSLNKEDAVHTLDLATGETMKLPLGLEATDLQGVHQMPDGRVIGVVGLTRGNVLNTAGLVQIYGP